MMKRIFGSVSDERGAETLEWVAVGALVVGVAIAVYPGTLQNALTDVITEISTMLVGIVT
jgi:Flp pilus assembly pilin Flp